MWTRKGETWRQFQILCEENTGIRLGWISKVCIRVSMFQTIDVCTTSDVQYICYMKAADSSWICEGLLGLCLPCIMPAAGCGEHHTTFRESGRDERSHIQALSRRTPLFVDFLLNPQRRWSKVWFIFSHALKPPSFLDCFWCILCWVESSESGAGYFPEWTIWVGWILASVPMALIIVTRTVVPLGDFTFLLLFGSTQKYMKNCFGVLISKNDNESLQKASTFTRQSKTQSLFRRWLCAPTFWRAAALAVPRYSTRFLSDGSTAKLSDPKVERILWSCLICFWERSCFSSVATACVFTRPLQMLRIRLQAAHQQQRCAML